MDKIKYYKAKREGTVIRVKKDIKVKPNNNSADFIMSSPVKNCNSASCLYCYASRHSPFGAPVETYSNLKEIVDEAVKHLNSLPPKPQPNQQGKLWCLEIGENTDLLAPSNIETTNYIIKRIHTETGAMTTFATKFGHPKNVAALISSLPNKGRVRCSLMPQVLSDLVEVGTSKIEDRIKGLNKIYELGYEGHINFAPLILHPNWQNNYIELFKLVDEILLPEVKKQLKSEVICLLHHSKLHEKNLEWASEEEKLLWMPELQEYKENNRGSKDILRYKLLIKKKFLEQFKVILKQYLPYCRIRYIF